MAQATVLSLAGNAVVVQADGTTRPLKVGDVIQKGETIRTAAGARVELMMEDGQVLAMGPAQSLRMDDTLAQTAATPDAQAAAAQPSTVDQITQVLEAGGDLTEELEAAAAGGGAGGGGDGSDFVRLLRVAEGTDSLSYEYGFNPLASVDGVELDADPVLEAPDDDGDTDPDPEDRQPVANDDSPDGVAVVTITRTFVEGEAFNGLLRVMGAGRGADSFESRLDNPPFQNAWLLSEASFRSGVDGKLDTGFTITDVNVGSAPSAPAFVVTPNFTALGGQTFSFTATTTSLAAGDAFIAKVYQKVDGEWTWVADIAPTTDTAYTYTFGQDGEYRIQFLVDDNSNNGQNASATVALGEDAFLFFGSASGFTEQVQYLPVEGNILDNDTLGDGDASDHTWAFDDATDNGDGSFTVQGQYGVLVLDADGNYTYTPDGSGSGTESFRYVLTDTDGDADDAVLTIDVRLDINGSAGADTLIGGDGNDIIYGGAGDDTLSGDDGADTFAWRLGDTGNDTITDFALGEDTLDIADLLPSTTDDAELANYLSITQNADGHLLVSIDVDGAGPGSPDYQITLLGVSLSDLDSTSLVEQLNKLQGTAGSSSA